MAATAGVGAGSTDTSSQISGSAALGSEELTEVKRVWALVDTDGSGSIDSTELRGLMRALGKGREPTALELQQVLDVVDANKDGVISWDEFRTAMAKWLGGGKRDLDDEVGSPKARKRIHRDISAFFTQFKPLDNFEELREKIKAEMDDVEDDLYASDPLQRAKEKELDAAAKTKLLADCTKAIPLVTSMQSVFATHDAARIMEQLDILKHLLGVTREFTSATLRDEIAPVLFNIWHTVTEWSIPLFLCEYLATGYGSGAETVAQQLARNKIVAAAMEVLYLYTLGPQVPHVREANKRWQQDNIWITTKLPLLKRHIVSNLKAHLAGNADAEIRANAAKLLASLASHHVHCWTAVNARDVMQACLTRMGFQGESVAVLRPVTLLISVLVGDTHSFELSADQFSALKGVDCLRVCAYMLQLPAIRTGEDGPFLIANTCAALAKLLPFVQTDLSVVKAVADVPKIPEFWNGAADSYAAQVAMQASFQCLLSLIKYNPAAAAWLAKSENTDVLGVIQTFFTKVEHQGLRLSSAKLLSALVHQQSHELVVAKKGMIPALITLLQTDKVLQTRIAQLIHVLTRQGPAAVRELVHGGVVPVLVTCLSQFRSHDDMLADVYKFAGPTYNFELVQHCLCALANILDAGTKAKVSATTPHPFLRLFSLDTVSGLRGLLMILAEERGSQHFSSGAAADDMGDLPTRVTSLLAAMRAAHDEATRQGSSVSASVVRTIDDLATMWKSAAARWAVYEAGGDSMEDVGSGGDLTMGDTGNAFADAYRKHAAGVGRVRVKATYRPTVASGAGAGAGAGDTGAFGLSAAAAASRDVTFSVPSNVSWQRLRSECAQQFGKPVEMQVERNDRSLITINDQRDLDSAIVEVERIPGKFLRLYVMDSYGMGAAAMPPPMEERGLPPKQVAIGRAAQALDFQGQRMSKKEIANLYDFFASRVGKDQGMSIHQFEKNMRSLGVTDSARIRALFKVFDVDGDGQVSFQECVTRLALFQRGTFEQRMQCVFSAYDVNNDGELERAELFQFMKHSTGYVDPVCWEQVEAMLRVGDMTGNGCLSLREFIAAVKANEALFTMYFIPTGGAGTSASVYENDYYT